MNGATAATPAKVGDIQLQSLDTLEWSPEQREQSISKVAEQAIGKAKEISAWYLSKKSRKQKWAVRFRGGAVVFTALAAILPIVAQMRVGEPTAPIPPALPSIV